MVERKSNKTIKNNAEAAIEKRILILRGHKVILSSDLADLYDVETRN